jgi:pyruvate kinase
MSELTKSREPLQLIVTLGPASNTPDIWMSMRKAGVQQFRLNTSHLSIGQTMTWLEQLHSRMSRPLVLDLQGSKWRLGTLPSLNLNYGDRVELVLKERSDHANQIPVPHQDFFKAARISGKEIVLNDARVIIEIESVSDESIWTRTLQSGPLASHKGITFRETTFRQESLGQKDLQIINLTKNMTNIRYAISYIRDAKELDRVRHAFGKNSYVIAKLERQSALDEAREIARLSNELWMCRGDLGAELGMLSMARALYHFNDHICDYSIPVMLAGQVFEHLTHHSTPTRSEICYCYDAIRKGYRGVVLSDETAIGRDPVNSCQTAAMCLKGEI